MTKLYNKTEKKELRRILRKQPILSEKLLWNRLRRKALGYKFRRQFGIGDYIVDFYCPELKFIIEIDGATHVTEKEIEGDKIRQCYLERLGLIIKRYTNNQVKNNIDFVVGDIKDFCDRLTDRY